MGRWLHLAQVKLVAPPGGSPPAGESPPTGGGIDSEGYGSGTAIPPGSRQLTEGLASGSSGGMTICRVRAWQNPGGGYEAGRYDPKTEGGACHYGWGGTDAWAGGATMEFLDVSKHHRWIDWDGNAPQGVVGTNKGTAHCAVNQYYGGQAWWPGKIIYGEGDKHWQCNVAAAGKEWVYWPGKGGSGTIRILVQ
jgi:hypothetical protein